VALINAAQTAHFGESRYAMRLVMAPLASLIIVSAANDVYSFEIPKRVARFYLSSLNGTE